MNPFLEIHDLATAKLYNKATIVDLKKTEGIDAPALTDGETIFLNTEENLAKIFPGLDMLTVQKILLWHEEMHLQLNHHTRYFQYLDEIEQSKCKLTQNEINIIMDILDHDSLFDDKMFPDLLETAKKMYAQLRNCNSLMYTFDTFTLEEMLDEYSKFKGEQDDSEGNEEQQDENQNTKDSQQTMNSNTSAKADSKDSKDNKDSKDPKDTQDADLQPTTKVPNRSEHQDVNWDDAPSEPEFITKNQGKYLKKIVARLDREKVKLANITKAVNGLVTSQRIRTYAVPSRYNINKRVIMKGRKPGKTPAYLIFDASGSMYEDMDAFKEIITKSIPQALTCPCEWFSGWGNDIKLLNPDYKNNESRNKNYYKGQFKDFLHIEASGGYSNDGDRVLDLCLEAEAKGYSPIGITDMGGGIRYEDKVKKLKRTIIVCAMRPYSKELKRINPSLQVICTDMSDEE